MRFNLNCESSMIFNLYHSCMNLDSIFDLEKIVLEYLSNILLYYLDKIDCENYVEAFLLGNMLQSFLMYLINKR